MSAFYKCCGARKSWTHNSHHPSCRTRRAEIASHAQRAERAHDWRTCRIPDCEACAYFEHHLDTAFEQEGRR